MQSEPPGGLGGCAGFLGVHFLPCAPGSPRFPDDADATGQALGEHSSEVVDRSEVRQGKHINK